MGFIDRLGSQLIEIVMVKPIVLRRRTDTTIKVRAAHDSITQPSINSPNANANASNANQSDVVAHSSTVRTLRMVVMPHRQSNAA